MLKTPSPRLLNIARALELQAAEAEGLSNRLRALGHGHEAQRVFRSAKEFALVAKLFLGTSETFNLFFHKGDPEPLPPEVSRFEYINPRTEVSESSAATADGAGVVTSQAKDV